MEPDEAKVMGERLRLALDMHDFGVEMLWFAIKRENPESTDSEVTGMLNARMRIRSGAELGDGVGRPGTWPR
jgi:hypothetical protein